MMFSSNTYAQTASSVTTIGYFYAASGQMMDAESNTGAMSSYLTRGERNDGTTETFAVSNIKDITADLDSSGNVLNKYTYTAYGTQTSYSPTTANSSSDIQNQALNITNNPFTYDGYFTDAESANYYLNARCYDPMLGIFLTSDSYNLPNREMYVNGNPVMGIDPAGHQFEDVFIKTQNGQEKAYDYPTFSKNANQELIKTEGGCGNAALASIFARGKIKLNEQQFKAVTTENLASKNPSFTKIFDNQKITSVGDLSIAKNFYNKESLTYNNILEAEDIKTEHKNLTLNDYITKKINEDELFHDMLKAKNMSDLGYFIRYAFNDGSLVGHVDHTFLSNKEGKMYHSSAVVDQQGKFSFMYLQTNDFYNKKLSEFKLVQAFRLFLPNS